MTIRNLEPVIASHPFFDQLSSEYVALISGCAKNVVFHQGTFVFRLGQPADAFFIVRHGMVALEAPGPEAETHRIQTVDEGDVLGWSWLFPPYRWMFDARALELTRAISIDGRCLREKCEADHSFGYEMMKRFSALVGNRLEAACMQIMDVYARSR
jgi:CRP-like cAMP-binding protein